jgi:hypothetical protein
MNYESQVLFLGFFKVGSESFSFSNYEDALKSKDLILKPIKKIFRPFCSVRFVPIFYNRRQTDH